MRAQQVGAPCTCMERMSLRGLDVRAILPLACSLTHRVEVSSCGGDPESCRSSSSDVRAAHREASGASTPPPHLRMLRLARLPCRLRRRSSSSGEQSPTVAVLRWPSRPRLRLCLLHRRRLPHRTAPPDRQGTRGPCSVLPIPSRNAKRSSRKPVLGSLPIRCPSIGSEVSSAEPHRWLNTRAVRSASGGHPLRSSRVVWRSRSLGSSA